MTGPAPGRPGAPAPLLRGAVLLLAAAESGLILWLLLRAEPLGADWTRRESWESLAAFGLFLLPPAAALLLAAAGRALGCALALVLLFAAMAFFALRIARTATVAG